MIPTLLVTFHTDLELYDIDVNYVPTISKYSIACMKKTVVVGLTPKQCTFCVYSDDIKVVGETKSGKSGTESLGSRLAGEASTEPDSLVPEDKPGTGIALLVYSSLQVLLYEI